ncbi:hypothetical protein HHL17_17215 [Chitinophaga sp. G-6-1-13]|uniref:Uncharacterized protein n=1 Tax=Chitinophaga fulva TaxID=2728842 RepID=A0A848GNJ0_9BACT|nr:hypothetical protein [Chitinophaga fulva]NML38949.1 hypothetical protein [Chitinophaga fulva]
MNNFSRLWLKPILIAVLTLSGLIAALVGDGIWDIYSWIALEIPVVLMIRYWCYPTKIKD